MDAVVLLTWFIFVDNNNFSASLHRQLLVAVLLKVCHNAMFFPQTTSGYLEWVQWSWPPQLQPIQETKLINYITISINKIDENNLYGSNKFLWSGQNHIILSCIRHTSVSVYYCKRNNSYLSSGLSPGSGPKNVRTWILLEIFSSNVTNLCNKETIKDTSI